MYIVYRYKRRCGSICEESRDETTSLIDMSYTRPNDAYSFVEFTLQYILSEYCNMKLAGKRFLDVGMGNGNVLYYVRELGTDVFGVDIMDYLDRSNYYEGRTFPKTDVREISKELLGTFDVAYQRYFSVPFKDTLEVLLAISKCLKSNGVYFVTFFDEEYYMHEDSFVVKILEEIYNEVKVIDEGSKIIASSPRINPVLTPMENYCYVLSEKEYNDYLSTIDYIGTRYGKEEKILTSKIRDNRRIYS